MDIALYISGIVAAVALTVFGVRRFGKRPSWKQHLVGFFGAVFLCLFLLTITTVMSQEGNASRLPLFYFGCLWAILATFRSMEHAGLGILVWFVLFLFLSFYHTGLAHSSRYTDNPQTRLKLRARLNLSLAKQEKPPLPGIVVRPTAHTWLTGLYAIE